MLGNHLAVEDKAAGAENHPTPGTEKPWLGEVALELAEPPTQAVAITRGEVLQALCTRRQLGVQLRLRAASRQAPEFGTKHPATGVEHQAPGRRLQLRAHTVTQAGGLEV
ncbi:hypothetical protein D9M69_669090 [compost metagenome]